MKSRLHSDGSRVAGMKGLYSQAGFPVFNFMTGFFTCIAVTLLQLVDQEVTVTANFLQIVIGQKPPTPTHLTRILIPLVRDLIPLTACQRSHDQYLHF